MNTRTLLALGLGLIAWMKTRAKRKKLTRAAVVGLVAYVGAPTVINAARRAGVNVPERIALPSGA